MGKGGAVWGAVKSAAPPCHSQSPTYFPPSRQAICRNRPPPDARAYLDWGGARRKSPTQDVPASLGQPENTNWRFKKSTKCVGVARKFFVWAEFHTSWTTVVAAFA
jgi:hypothetical protein